jgi:hypothetical protein
LNLFSKTLNIIPLAAVKARSTSGKNALGNNPYFDPKAGFVGATVMGLAVLWVNMPHGLDLAWVAALKQFIYTFIMGGIVARVCENIAVNFNPAAKAILCAILIPGLATVGLTYLLHSMKGTPEPFLSTLPTIITAPIILTIWSLKKRNELKKISG